MDPFSKPTPPTRTDTCCRRAKLRSASRRVLPGFWVQVPPVRAELARAPMRAQVGFARPRENASRHNSCLDCTLHFVPPSERMRPVARVMLRPRTMIHGFVVSGTHSYRYVPTPTPPRLAGRAGSTASCPGQRARPPTFTAESFVGHASSARGGIDTRNPRVDYINPIELSKS